MLSYYKSKDKISGWLSLDQDGKLVIKGSPRPGYISIVELKHSNLVEEMMLYVNQKKK